MKADRADRAADRRRGPARRSRRTWPRRRQGTRRTGRRAWRPGDAGPVRHAARLLRRRRSLRALSRDPTQAGIAAVIGAGEILKPRGTDAAIEYFTKLLPEAKNPAVQRAIRVQLAELYKQAGKQDEALEQLRELIVTTTGDETPPPPPQCARNLSPVSIRSPSVRRGRGIG